MSVPETLARMSPAELAELERRAEADPEASPAAKQRLSEHIARERAARVVAS